MKGCGHKDEMFVFTGKVDLESIKTEFKRSLFPLFSENGKFVF